MIRVKAITEPKNAGDGYRIIVEPEWPRGVPKGKAAACHWMRSLGPSANLLDWRRRNPRKSSGFRDRYLAEIGHNEKDVSRVATLLKEYGTVTILKSENDVLDVAETLAEYLRAVCDTAERSR